MDKIEASWLLRNLTKRVSHDDSGQAHLHGILTEDELAALDYAMRVLEGSAEAHDQNQPPRIPEIEAEPSETLDFDDDPEQEFYEEESAQIAEIVALDASTLDLPPVQDSIRICLDFGTAMSKAVLVQNDGDAETIEVLGIGVNVNQISDALDNMLVSSIFIGDEGLLYFGQEAIDESVREGIRENAARIDNIKRCISEGGDAQDIALSEAENPTGITANQGQMVVAMLMFITWSINQCLKQLGYAANVNRRFAIPCLERERENQVVPLMCEMLGQAQILADTFDSKLPSSLALSEFIQALEAAQESDYTYEFITGHLNEPMGVAGSRVSFEQEVDRTILVVDVGAGTTDMGLFHLKHDPDGEASPVAAGAKDSEVVLTYAGNWLDLTLLGYVSGLAGVSHEDPDHELMLARLKREIRENKEFLFAHGEVTMNLETKGLVEVNLEEFMATDAIREFTNELEAGLTSLLNGVSSDWVESLGQRRLAVVFTGGGAGLPMVRSLANRQVQTDHGPIFLEAAELVPNWIQDVLPAHQPEYPQLAVAIGGARELKFDSMGSFRSFAGGARGGHELERF